MVLFCWEGLWFVIDVRVPELAYERERERRYRDSLSD